MRFLNRLFLAVALLVCASLAAQSGNQRKTSLLVGEPGTPGGKLAIATRAEPKTLNPVTAIDQPSRDVLGRMMADLIHINRYTQKTEPALASSWTASPDGKRYTLTLRRGVRFSDGAPFDADDVVFSFRVYQDEKVQSPQRALLVVSGEPVKVEKLNAYKVRFSFVAPHAAAERIFDSVAMLPRHLLEKDYESGRIAQSWTVSTSPDKIAGLGPFRLKSFVPGERIVLERNPHYWKTDSRGQRLPYLDEFTFLVAPSQDAEVLRFRAGDTQITGSLSADNFTALLKDREQLHLRLEDAGPGLEYNFLLFNLNSDVEGRFPEAARRQKWFTDVRFRQAVSAAIDRDAIVRLVYQGRASALTTNVTPAYKPWINTAIPAPRRSVDRARQLLKSAGFSWRPDGGLVDASGQPVEFSILVSSSNGQRSQMAALVQEDLKQVGIKASVNAMEFRSMASRILEAHNFDTALLGLGGGDIDPNPAMSMWLSTGANHLWRMVEAKPLSPWQAEIDGLLEKQMVTVDYRERKKLYDRVQEIAAEQLPIICLASPHILVGARANLGNFQPAVLEHYSLWNVDELFWRSPSSGPNGRKQ